MTTNGFTEAVCPLTVSARLPTGRTCRTYRIIFAAAFLLLTLPASVDARPGYKVHPGGVEFILPVENRDGRVVSVSADRRQRVRFTVDGQSSGTTYAMKGRVSSHRIEADFPTLGRVDVRLRLARHRPGVLRQPHCKGHDPIEGVGTYRGMIEFPGEGGIAEVSVRHGRFYFERRFRQVCKRHRPMLKPGALKLRQKIEEGNLTVSGKGEGRMVRLNATIFAFRRNPARSASVIRAEVNERREAVRITRWAGGSFGHNAVRMSRRGKEPETVDVELPEPFSGHALYSRRASSPSSWIGDLSVALPGADQAISLTGPGFGAVLCRGGVGRCQ